MALFYTDTLINVLLWRNHLARPGCSLNLYEIRLSLHTRVYQEQVFLLKWRREGREKVEREQDVNGPERDK